MKLRRNPLTEALAKNLDPKVREYIDARFKEIEEQVSWELETKARTYRLLREEVLNLTRALEARVVKVEDIFAHDDRTAITRARLVKLIREFDK